MYGHIKKRFKMSRGKSRSSFSRIAQYIHPVNIHNSPARGGFRL